MDRASRVAASRAELATLKEPALAELVPSRRDFTQYLNTQRRELAAIARMADRPRRDGDASDPVVELAQRYDDAEVAALLLDPSVADWRAISSVVSAPLLRNTFALTPQQIYHSRLLGADAVLVPAAELDLEALSDLAAVASSLHMAVVLELDAAAQIERALRVPRCVVGLSCETPAGEADLAAVIELARHLPASQLAIVLNELRELDAIDSLRGLVDAVTVGHVLDDAANVRAVVERIAVGVT